MDQQEIGQDLPNEVEDVQTTPEQSETAEQAANHDDSAPSEKTNEDTSERVPKGVQKRIDRLTREKYEAKAKADYLEQMIRQQQQPQPQAVSQDGRPSKAQFASDEDFIEALTDWKLQQRERAVQAQETQRQQMTMAQKQEKLIAEAEADEGFDLDHFSQNVRVTDVMAQAILESDMGAKLIVHLNANPDESTRIANLPPARQAAELGKLEAKLSIAAVAKSKAPTPIKPVGGRGVPASGLSDELPIDEWMARHNRRR